MLVRRAAAVLVLALAPALVACSHDGISVPTTTTSGSSTTETTLIDYSTVVLRPVGGKTTTTAQTVGTSDVQGFAHGPNGPLQGTTIRVERLVFDTVVRTDLLTQPDGSFDLPNIPGGRYRVRAFIPPTLAQVKPEVFFLREGEQKKLDLAMSTHSGLEVKAAVNPNPPLLDEDVNLVVQVVTSSVDADGIVRSQPVPDELVQLSGGNRWRLRTTNPVTSDSAGRAPFGLTCTSTGPPGLVVQLSNGQIYDLTLPNCIDPATLTTTTTAGSSTSSTGGTTSTTKKQG